MRLRSVKNCVVGLVSAGVFLGGAGVAVAASWHGLPARKSDGVRFEHAEYRLNAPGVNHGSFEWRGDLTDKSHTDGHNVYVLVKVEGHDWVRYNGKQNKTVTMHHSNWDGAERYTMDAYLRACRDRGSLNPDNCSHPVHYNRR
ncbi:MAG: hypothetical protein LBV60_06980 [Streptomyces sp.]|jgi:hypothetical protein|nr:hypothetical protein [Streptomyces sp.]